MYISTHQALLDFCQRALEFDAIAVDTEFLRERTFHPRLCWFRLPPLPRASRSILW